MSIETRCLSPTQADIDARNFTGRIHVRYDNGCLVISAEQPPPPRAYVTVDRDGNVEGYRPPSPPTRVGTGRGRRERPPSPGAAAVSPPPPLKRRSRTARSRSVDDDDDDRRKVAKDWREGLARGAALPRDGEPVSAEAAAAAAAATGRPKRQCRRKFPLYIDDDDDDDDYVYSPGGPGPYPNPDRDMGPSTRLDRRNAAIRYHSRDPNHDPVEDYFEDWRFHSVVPVGATGGHCLCGQTHLSILYKFTNDQSKTKQAICLGGVCVAKCRKLNPGTFDTGDVEVGIDDDDDE